MKRCILLLFFTCWCILSIQAQQDSILVNRYVMRSTLYGIGYTNILDTYLSPAEYTGAEIRILRENMRMTRLLNGKVSRQSLFQAQMAMTENRAGTGSEFAFLANWNFAWHYQHRFNEHIKLLVGPNIDLNGGMIYNFRNSNNPVQAKAYVNLGASGMTIYRFNIKEYPFVLRYQLNLPLLGIMFSPEYGQPYYEMSISHDWGKNLCFTSLHNQPAIRQFITLDFPIKSLNVRVGYVCDIQQSKVNHLRNHTWSHTFMAGIVKNFYVLKGKNKVAMPASVSPY
ncbi:MAG: DUF3316 domain-containing protein [Bacteroidaceae bacterium]|nr:DUF3316 domain-containing protein [Bacteroidaceae bacterium]